VESYLANDLTSFGHDKPWFPWRHKRIIKASSQLSLGWISVSVPLKNVLDSDMSHYTQWIISLLSLEGFIFAAEVIGW